MEGLSLECPEERMQGIYKPVSACWRHYVRQSSRLSVTEVHTLSMAWPHNMTWFQSFLLSMTNGLVTYMDSMWTSNRSTIISNRGKCFCWYVGQFAMVKVRWMPWKAQKFLVKYLRNQNIPISAMQWIYLIVKLPCGSTHSCLSTFQTLQNDDFSSSHLTFGRVANTV